MLIINNIITLSVFWSCTYWLDFLDAFDDIIEFVTLTKTLLSASSFMSLIYAEW